ncbi:MAG: ribonuclease H-like domain-containing protein [Acidobacteriia bacterium]|nr:ribonuclease H-like domain-containing protein [Terriglobia bacterium]
MIFDKFSHIAALRPRAEAGKPAGTPAEEDTHARLVRLPGAELRTTLHGCHLAVTCRFPSPGPCRIGPRAQRLLAPNPTSEVGDPSHWIFLDTETTGLSGGTGTYAFLVGLAWWDGDGFVVEQLFMRDHSEEASLLLDLSHRLVERDILVTFNGKSFDWPLLETRYRMTRAAAVERPAAHLDLLHPARQLWRLRLKSVALAELEKQVLQFERGPDIPSHSIPGRYFDFLRGGPEEPIIEVFRHNQMDLRGLAALAARITSLLEGPENSGGDAGELYGVSRMLHRHGEELLAQEGYQRALTCGLPQEADRMARRELALLARRHGDFDRATALWETLLDDSIDGIRAYEQLAIYYEHRAREPERAQALARSALTRLREAYLAGRLEAHQYRRWHAAFRHRLDRLQARLNKQS